jgi:hypothetical protein
MAFTALTMITDDNAQPYPPKTLVNWSEQIVLINQFGAFTPPTPTPPSRVLVAVDPTLLTTL